MRVKEIWKKQWVKNGVFFGILAIIYFTDVPKWINVQLTKMRLEAPADFKGLSEPTQSVYKYSIEFENAEGESTQLSDFQGNTLFVNFWASWCVPCLAEFEAMEKLKAKFPNSSFIFVNLEDQESFAKYVEKTDHALPFWRLMTPIPEELRHQAIPATFILNEEGQVVLKHIGGMDWSESRIVHKLQDYLN